VLIREMVAMEEIISRNKNCTITPAVELTVIYFS